MEQKKRVLGKPRRTIGAPVRAPVDNQSNEAQSPTKVLPGSPLRETILQEFNGISIDEESLPVRFTTPDIILSDADILDGINTNDNTPTLLSNDVKQDEIENEGSFVCPICNEVMVSLLQLNRHIDDLHSSPSPPKNIISTPNEEIKSWLKKTSEVGSKLQVALPKKFANFDIFDTSIPLTDSSRDSSSTSLNTSQPEIKVTRRHWRKPQQNQVCSSNHCNKRLNVKNGIVNCRRCGNLFCNEHTLFRLKLNQNAQYDTSGVWCRCCEDCFKGKPGYKDFGTVRDLSLSFTKKRQVNIDEKQLYENKLHKRIINMVRVFSSIDHELRSEQFFQRMKANQKKKEAEQRIVHWENEQFVLSCFLCFENFTFTLRKHHCRLCGRVVCGSETTNCSKEITLSTLSQLVPDSPSSNDPYQMRVCHHCEDVLSIRKNFTDDMKSPLSPLLKILEHQQKIKVAILFLIPKFQKLIQTLQHSEKLDDHILKETSKQRKRLVESFAQFDKLTKEMLNLQTDIQDEQRLQQSIKAESFAFIQKNMAPLKQLPKILQDIEKKQKEIQPVKLSHTQVQQIKQNREALMVLNEQKFLVQEMISNCKKQRKFDEIATLEQNLNDLDKMIEELQTSLGSEGF